MAAKIWTLKEIIEAVHKSNDPEVIRELCRRFPILTVTVAKVDYASGIAISEAIPDYVRPIGMERQLLHDQGQADPDDPDNTEAMNPPAEEEAEEEPAEQKDPADVKREKDRKRQQRKRQKDRDAKDAQAAEEAALAAEEKANASKYEEIGAVKLFEMCKARGLDVQPRKKQRFYIDILEADDAKKAAEEEEASEPKEDEEDWGEEEDLEEEVKKSEKSSKSKKSQAKKTEPEPEDDDEEDWEI